MPAQLPPFSSVLKSRDVEDPVNVWVHRPLAYAFVALVYRTALTPNQVTLLALAVGLAAAGCFVHGAPAAMLWGGALLWCSAILDGADGILARARRSHSELGRALDGTADAAVGAATGLGAIVHLGQQGTSLPLLLAMPVAVASAVVHIYLYDFYKESYAQQTDPAWDGVPLDRAETRRRLEASRAAGAGLPEIVAGKLYVDLVAAQTALVTRLDSHGAREHLRFAVDARTVAVYRQHNRLPMKLWASLSLAPHSYMMAICAMLDRLDAYLWLRIALGNALFVTALLLQRRASCRTRQALAAIGMAPVPAHAS